MITTNQNKFYFIISIPFGVILFLLSQNFPLFWDNVLFAAKMGGHLYENNILNWTMPNSFDPGHPPFLGFILALFWKVFGKSLWVSHLAMIPFVMGAIYQLFLWVKNYVENPLLIILGSLLLLADPTFFTQLLIVNPEVIILFFFLLALNNIEKNNTLKFIGLFFLSIVSFRSMMLFAGFFLYEVLSHLWIEKKRWSFFNFKFILFYFFAALPGISFVIWRLATKGWLQTHLDSPWSSLWRFANLSEFFKNCIVLIWRYLDFGRVVVFVFLIICTVFLWKKIKVQKKIQRLTLLGFTSVFFVIVTSLMATNAFGHRYFIISYLAFILLSFLILTHLKPSLQKIVYTILFVGLLTGNLWIYPKNISQGWDASLAHIPYYELRQDGINFLDKNKIKTKKVASFFPNVNEIGKVDLTNDKRSFSNFSKHSRYVFYSNVYNLSDQEHQLLATNFTPLKTFENCGIEVIIFKNNTSLLKTKE